MRKVTRALFWVVIAVLVIGGCSISNSGGLLSGVGLGNASSVRLVLVGNCRVRDKAMVRDLYAAVEHPGRDYASKMARERQIAFVGHDGRVAYFGYSVAGDLTDHQGSDSLMGLLRQVFKNPVCRKPTHISIGSLSYVRAKLPGKTAAVSAQSNGRWKSVQISAVKLLQEWSPNNLSGCKVFRQHEIDKLSDRYIEVRLSRPTSFETLIVPRDFEWWPPPKRVETRTKFEKVNCESIRLLSIEPGTMRLAFGLTGTGNWILSNMVGTKEFLGYGPQGMSQFGPDLFEELVFQITKP
ncbi:MAG: hypothetical protein Q7T82_14480 [Armatimonadota bacterium]|nr:hypothetical protein [Armatimonadota bacterium]